MKQYRVGWMKVILLVLAIAAVVSGCGQQAKTDEKRSVVDMTGKTVTLPQNVNRVAVNGAMNQVVLMLGNGDKIVATANVLKDNPVFAKIYPRIKDIPAPFDFMAGEVNAEELAKTRPDVVIGGNPRGNNASLESLGIPVVNVNLRNPEEIKQAVLLVGEVLGPKEAEKAAAFCRYYDDNMKKVTARTHDISREQRPKVYYAGNKPTLTDGKESITTSWIEMAGGVNVAADNGVSGIGREVSLEDVIRWNPDIIIVTAATTKAAIMKSEQWQKIGAVKNNRVYINPKGVYLWSVRSAEEALQTLWSAKVIQPDRFGDLDMNREVREFYKRFYFYDVTDKEISDILNP